MKYIFIFLLSSLFLLSGCSNDKNEVKNSEINSELNSNASIGNYSASSISTVVPKEEIISTFSTPVNFPEETDRQTNMTICCDTLNGTIVKAGTEFSFCDTVRTSYS